MRLGLLALAGAAFLAASLLVGRWLTTDNVERAAVLALLRAQARGDAEAMVRALGCRDARCVALARANARRLRARGELEIARYDSDTARALGEQTGPTRVVWFLGEDLPTVQCVQVRRRGTPLTGPTVTLLRLSAPIGREAPCRN